MAELSDNVRKFWQEMTENEELARKFQEAKAHPELVALAQEIGLEISVEELEAAMGEAMKLADEEELTDEQLEAVAGGMAFTMAAFTAAATAAAKAGAIAAAKGAVAGAAGYGTKKAIESGW